MLNLNLIFEQILFTYVKTTINPPTITKNIERGIHAENVVIRVIRHIKTVCIKIINPNVIGWFNIIIVLERKIIKDKIILIIPACSLKKILVLETKVIIIFADVQEFIS